MTELTVGKEQKKVFVRNILPLGGPFLGGDSYPGSGAEKRKALSSVTPVINSICLRLTKLF